jgi:hypothetical protein
MDVNGGVAGGPGGPGPGLPRKTWPRRRVAALLAACAVVGGCAFAVTYALSGPAPGAPAKATTAAAAPGAASGLAGQAAVLNGVLADATYGSSAATGTGTRPDSAAAVRRVARLRLRRALVRLRALGGMYGQFSFETKQGPRTLAFERGTVTSVAGRDAVVRATDGTTWTWVLTSASIVRENGARVRATALATGDLVFAAGPVSGTTRDARLIVIRAA